MKGIIFLTMSAMAGICFVSRRHITGGVLLSVSLLFGGLALTAITLRADMDKEEDDDE